MNVRLLPGAKTLTAARMTAPTPVPPRERSSQGVQMVSVAPVAEGEAQLLVPPGTTIPQRQPTWALRAKRLHNGAPLGSTCARSEPISWTDRGCLAIAARRRILLMFCTLQRHWSLRTLPQVLVGAAGMGKQGPSLPRAGVDPVASLLLGAGCTPRPPTPLPKPTATRQVMACWIACSIQAETDVLGWR